MFLKDWNLIHPYPWLPCEDHSYLKQPFISAHPLKMLKSGNYNKVPILIGQTCLDGKFLDFRDYDFYDNQSGMSHSSCQGNKIRHSLPLSHYLELG